MNQNPKSSEWKSKSEFPFLEFNLNGVIMRITDQHPESQQGQFFYSIGLLPGVWHPVTILEDRTDPESRRPVTDIEEAKAVAIYYASVHLKLLSIHLMEYLKDNTVGIQNGDQIALNLI